MLVINVVIKRNKGKLYEIRLAQTSIYTKVYWSIGTFEMSAEIGLTIQTGNNE